MNMDEKQLPPGWELVTINDLCAINPKHVAGIPDETPVSFVPMAAVSDVHGRIETPEVRPYGEVKRGFTHFADGDVIFAKITPCMENGKAASVRGLVNAIGCGTTEFFVFRSKGALSQDYLFYFIRQESYRKLARTQMQSGVGQARVPREFIEDTELPLPPLPEQRRIVAKIEALQERSGRAAKALEEVGPLLEQFRQSILAAAFSGRLTADWREKNRNVEPAHELLARIRTERRQRWEQAELAKYEAKGKQPPKDWKDEYEEPEPVDESDLPELPDGWCWAAAEEIVEHDAEIVYGIVQPGPHIQDGIPYVRGKDIVNGTILVDQLLKTSQEIAARYERASLREGDVLLGIIRATKVAVVPETLTGGNITQGTARFRPSAIIRTLYLAGCLDTPFCQSWLHAHYRGIDMPGLNLRDVRRLPIPLAPLSEQSEIEDRIRKAERSIANAASGVAESVDNLSQLNQSILAKAFRGELVPQDPNDEPASELLARIRREREVSGDSVHGSGRKKKAGGKGNASESARPAKRSKRSAKAASATTPEPSTDASPEPASPQRRRRRSSLNNVDESLVIRVLAEGGAVNIHADTSGPTVQFYTQSSGGGFLAEIEDIPEAALKPRESKRVANLSDLMDPDLALLYPNDVNETYLPQLRDWYTWAAPQLPEHFENEFLERAKSRWSEALQIEEPSTSQSATKAKRGRLFDA